MKSSGTIYVGATFALLAAYFSYQWWFNPSRALKRQMGEVAEALSVPAGESDVARIARLARLGRHLADNVRVRAGDAEISSRDAILGAEPVQQVTLLLVAKGLIKDLLANLHSWTVKLKG